MPIFSKCVHFNPYFDRHRVGEVKGGFIFDGDIIITPIEIKGIAGEIVRLCTGKIPGGVVVNAGVIVASGILESASVYINVVAVAIHKVTGGIDGDSTAGDGDAGVIGGNLLKD